MSPWIRDNFRYSRWLLERIAASYQHIYDRIVLSSYTETLDGSRIERERTISNRINLIEYKADFDRALSAIGTGQWEGIKGLKISNYKGFGRLQKVIIADVLGINSWELEEIGFYRIPQIRGYAYHLMADRLNGLPHHGTKTQFIAKLET